MLTRKEVRQRLKAKAKAKTVAERVYIYTYPRVCIQRKLTWGKGKLESSNIVTCNEIPYNVRQEESLELRM